MVRDEIGMIAVSEQVTDLFLNRPMRPASRKLAALLLNKYVSPDAITTAWAATYIGAALLFAQGTPRCSLFGSLCILLAGFLDCLDGDLARARHKSSTGGAFLEQTFHWICQAALIIGIVVGYGAPYSMMSPLLFLGIALVADQMFHLTYFIINSGYDQTKSYWIMHRMTALLYPLMPINFNLIWISGLIGLPLLGLTIWVTVAVVVTVLNCVVYYWVERS
jgi:phosphatidylglycerophosphate synthase